jgi:hypothetical protein
MTAYNAFRQGLWELCLLVRKTIGGSSARFHLETPGKCRSIGESGPLRSCDQRVSSGPVARTIPILTKPTSAWPRFSSGRKNRKPRVDSYRERLLPIRRMRSRGTDSLAQVERILGNEADQRRAFAQFQRLRQKSSELEAAKGMFNFNPTDVTRQKGHGPIVKFRGVTIERSQRNRDHRQAKLNWSEILPLYELFQ